MGRQKSEAKEIVSDAYEEIDSRVKTEVLQTVTKVKAKEKKPAWKKPEEEKLLARLIRIEPALFAEIEKFQGEESIGSFTEAARALWRKGLKAHRSEKIKESVPVKLPDGMVFKQGPNGVILAADNS